MAAVPLWSSGTLNKSYWLCDTEAELPSGATVGSKSYTKDSEKLWIVNTAGTWIDFGAGGGGGGGVTDHGALTGLSDDDHPQYHTDARGDIRYYLKAAVDALLATKSDVGHNHAGVYEPADADLTAIAGLAPSNDDLIQRKAGAWTNRTPAQVKTDLALTKGDVGLGSVDNTSDANKPISTATQAALDAKVAASLFDANTILKADVDNTPEALTVLEQRILGRITGGEITGLTAAEVKTLLALVKVDVGLGNVDNTSDANKPVSTAQQAALDLKAPLASPTFTGIVTVPNDSFTYAKLQNVSATDKLLGRATAGAGDIEEIALTAAGRALIDDADAAAQRTTLGLGNVDNTSDANKPVSTAQQTALDLKVDESLFDANAILKADSDNTPAALTVAEDRVVGRVAGGQITALTAAQVKTLLSLVAADLPTHDIITKHNGFPGGTSNFLRADGTFAAPTASLSLPIEYLTAAAAADDFFRSKLSADGAGSYRFVGEADGRLKWGPGGAGAGVATDTELYRDSADFLVTPDSFAAWRGSGGETQLGISSTVPGIAFGNTAATTIRRGTGSPEGVVTANPGSYYMRTDGDISTASYIKATGTGNTGWIPIGRVPFFVRKSADEGVTNSAVLQSDDHIILPIAANEIWELTIKIFYTGGGTAHDGKIQWSVPASVTFDGQFQGLNTDDTALVGEHIQQTTSRAFGAGVASRAFELRGLMVAGATAGNCILQWAQNVATAAQTLTFKARSYMIAFRVA